MRIGIVSDIHCNLAGLRAAVAAVGAVAELVCAGDLVYQFRFSNEVVRELKGLGARVILGNHDEVILGPHGERARSAPHVDRDLVRWLAEQPTELRTTVNGRRLLVVHASPREPRKEYLYPNDMKLRQAAELDADVLVYGHTHYQHARTYGRVLVVNPGSAGEPRDPRNGFRLSCAVLDTETLEVRFIDYPDPTRTIAADSSGAAAQFQSNGSGWRDYGVMPQRDPWGLA